MFLCRQKEKIGDTQFRSAFESTGLSSFKLNSSSIYLLAWFVVWCERCNHSVHQNNRTENPKKRSS